MKSFSYLKRELSYNETNKVRGFMVCTVSCAVTVPLGAYTEYSGVHLTVDMSR